MMDPVVLAAVRDVLSRHAVDPRIARDEPHTVSLQSLGIPSVDMIGIVIDLEDRFGKPIDQARLHELHTLEDLVTALGEP